MDAMARDVITALFPPDLDISLGWALTQRKYWSRLNFYSKHSVIAIKRARFCELSPFSTIFTSF
jgi:hypothetical protein